MTISGAACTADAANARRANVLNSMMTLVSYYWLEEEEERPRTTRMSVKSYLVCDKEMKKERT